MTHFNTKIAFITGLYKDRKISPPAYNLQDVFLQLTLVCHWSSTLVRGHYKFCSECKLSSCLMKIIESVDIFKTYII